MAIKLEILTENKESLRAFGEIRDAVVKTSNLLEQIAKDMGKIGTAGTTAAKETDRAFDQANKSVSKLSKEVDKSTAGFDKLTKAAGAFFTLQAARGFAEKIFAVRQEIESLQTSFRILVGDKDKADALFQGIKEFATTTPMQMKDLASAAQTMMGFGIPLEQIMENLKAIGDVSMGDAQRFQGLALSFSQMSAAGKLMGQDLMQMINAGFNPLATISEKTGKSIGTLKDEMAKGAISADMVRQAFIDATSEGGKFHGMLEEQSKTLKGAYSNLQGAIDDMFNSIGEKMQGTFTTAIDTATYLAKNYEQVGKVILTVVAAFGAYKAALMAVKALEISRSVMGAATAFIGLAKEVRSAKDAMLLFNLATKANPIGLVLSVVASAAAAFALFRKKTDDAAATEKKFNEVSEKATANVKALYATLGTATKGTKVAADTAKELKTIAEEYGVKLSDEATKIGNETKLVDELTKKREMLIDAIKRETIERERANQQKAIEDSYASNIEEARTDLKDNLSSKFSEQARGVMAQIITEDDIQRVGKAEAEYRRLKEQVGAYSHVAQEAARERGRLTNDLIAKVRAYAIELGRAEGDEHKYAEEAYNIVNAVSEFISVTNDSVVAQDNARVALANATLATTTQISVQDAATASADVLNTRTQALIDLWNNAHPEMTFTVHYEDSEIPAWMKGLTDSVLKQSIAGWQKAVDLAREKGLGPDDLVRYGDTTLTVREANKQLARLQSHANSREKPKPTVTPKVTTPKTPKKTKKTGKNTNTNTGPSPEEIAEKKTELQLRNKREEERAARELALSTREAEIQAMKEGTDKVLAQIELDYDREIEAIRKGNEDLLQERVDDAKALWDADPKNKKKNFYASKEYANALQDGYTLSELDNIGAREQAAEAERSRRKKELTDSEAEKWREYEIQYGNYQQKRLAITEKYNKLIEETTSDAQKAIYSQQAEKELEELDDKIMESSKLWSDYFGKFETRSSSAIRGVMKDIQDLIYYMSGMEGAEIPDIFKENKETLDAINEAMEDPEARAKFIEGLRKQFKTFEKMVDANNPFKMISKGFKDGSNKDMADGFKQIADAMGTVSHLLDEVGIKSNSTVGKITSAIGNTANLAAQGAQIGGVYGAAAGAAIGIAQGIIGELGADYSSYNKLVEEYAGLIDVWDELIAKKKEYISESYGAEAIKVSQEAQSLVNNEIEAWRRLGRERLASGAGLFSHSVGVKVKEGMSEEDWQGASKYIGYDLGKLFDLSSEQLEKLKSEAPSFWAKLDGDVRDYLDKIIKAGDTLDEINEKTREQLTNTSFDSVYDSFISSLSDMDKSAYDFSKDFEKYMFNAVLNAQVGKLFKTRLEDWHKAFADAMADGQLSDTELATLKAEYDAIVKEGIATRDELSKVTGYGSSGEGDGTFKSVSSFTQEQGDILNGRLTAIQIGVQNGNLLRQQIANTLGLMSTLMGGEGSAVNDMRDLMAVQNTHLEDIVSINKKMLSDFGEKMDKMNVQLETKL